MIGLFVVCAIFLLAASIVVLSSGNLFTKKFIYAMYFDESIRGLNPGSGIFFRGVQVGQVKEIKLFYKEDDMTLHSVVIAVIEPENIIKLKSRNKIKGESNQIHMLIKRGLRAQLTLQSLVTSQLIIILDFFPGSAETRHNYLPEYDEIPTIPTQLEQFTQAVSELHLKETAKKLIATIDGIESFINSPETKENLKQFLEAGKTAHSLIKKVDEGIIPLLNEIRMTTDSAKLAMEQAQKTLAMEEGVPGKIASDARQTIDKAQETLKNIDKSLASIDRFMTENTEVSYQAEDTLKEFSEIAASLKSLTDYLERHPESLIRGKEKIKGAEK